MSNMSKRVIDIALLAVAPLLAMWTATWIVRMMDPNRDKKNAAKKQVGKVLQRLKANNVELNEYENMVAGDVVDPSDIHTTWQDIGGLDETVETLVQAVVLPLTRPDLFPSGSSLLRAPRGVLLHGPPGCGKTLIAKALAKEAGCCFICLQPSTFMDKWYGESQKIVDAVFSLAAKLEPSIIFLDEIDSFLRTRSSSDHEASALTKAQFMTLWDGLSSDAPGNIVVVGATNRPWDVDRAILRRMPRTFQIGLPNEAQRASVLMALLRNENVTGDFNIYDVASFTDGFSGNDLHELCRNTAMAVMRRRLTRDPRTGESTRDEALVLTTADFRAAYASVRASFVETSRDGMEESIDSLN